jgi:glyceraldehyde 3-phosphate dehydrogenase
VGINEELAIQKEKIYIKLGDVDGAANEVQNLINHDTENLIIDGVKVKYTSIKDPELLPWAALNIDVVIESTGFFTSMASAQKHIEAGAKFVIISAPTKDTPMIVNGVNNSTNEMAIFSCASCTTNNTSPIIEILGRRIGIKKAILNTIHAYTTSQSLVDGPSNKNFRMGRAAAMNLAPSTTGAAIATTKIVPQIEGKFDGVAVRVPVPVGSISDITFITEKPTSIAEINSILAEESKTQRYQKVVAVSSEPLVSTDIIKSPYAATIDLGMTKVVDGDLVKVMAWYDNEWGFTNQMIRLIQDL